MKRSSLFAFAMFAAFSLGFLPAKSLHASACDNPGDCKGTTEEATPPPAPSTSASGCWKPGGNNCQLIQGSCVCQQDPTTPAIPVPSTAKAPIDPNHCGNGILEVDLGEECEPGPYDLFCTTACKQMKASDFDDYGFLCITTEQCKVGVITTVNSKRVCTFQHDPACDLGPTGAPTSPTAPEPSSPSTPTGTPNAPATPAAPAAPTEPVSDPTSGVNAPSQPIDLPATPPSPTLPPTNEDPTGYTHGPQAPDNGGDETINAGDCSDGVIVLGQCRPKEFLFIKGGGGDGCALVVNGGPSGSATPVAALIAGSCFLLLILKSRRARGGK